MTEHNELWQGDIRGHFHRGFSIVPRILKIRHCVAKALDLHLRPMMDRIRISPTPYHLTHPLQKLNFQDLGARIFMFLRSMQRSKYAGRSCQDPLFGH